MSRKLKNKKLPYIAAAPLLFLALYLLSAPILGWLGHLIVVDEKPSKSDAVVVLNSGVEYYPRLIEAADLYNRGLASKVVINGNRKNEALVMLEEKGLTHCCHWCEEMLRILALYDVPRQDVLCLSAENAYDTVSEAHAVGSALTELGYRNIIVTTSKYHTRRARHIWRNTAEGRLHVRMIPAATDPYDPDGWWREGRQIRWVLAEYGAWVFYWWKQLTDSLDEPLAPAVIDIPAGSSTGESEKS